MVEKPINNVLYDTVSFQDGKQAVFVENDQGRFLLKTNDMKGNVSYLIWIDYQRKQYNKISFDVSGNLMSNFRYSNDVLDGYSRYYSNGFLRGEKFYDKGTLTSFAGYKDGKIEPKYFQLCLIPNVKKNNDGQHVLRPIKYLYFIGRSQRVTLTGYEYIIDGVSYEGEIIDNDYVYVDFSGQKEGVHKWKCIITDEMTTKEGELTYEDKFTTFREYEILIDSMARPVIHN